MRSFGRNLWVVVILLPLVVAPPVHAFALGVVCPMACTAGQPGCGSTAGSETGQVAAKAACGLHCTAIGVPATMVTAEALLLWRPVAGPLPESVTWVIPLDPAPPRTTPIA